LNGGKNSVGGNWRTGSATGSALGALLGAVVLSLIGPDASVTTSIL